MKKNIFVRAATLFVLVLFLFSLVGCEGRERSQESSFFAFDTVCTVWDYTGMDGEAFLSLAEDIKASANHYHRLFDAYNEVGDVVNIASLNRLAGTGPVEVDPAIIDLLTFSEEMYELTGGKVNFALGSVTYLWKSLTSGKNPRIPTEAEITEAGKHISPDSVIIDKESSTVEITDARLRIDVGAIAKGYTAELIKAELLSLGYEGIILDFGGNICAVGKEKQIPIRNPLYFEGADEPYIRETLVRSEALVTSGVYQRYCVIDGVRYHHIIDTDTLRPETRYLSVSVRAAHSGVADALSTALFNMDFDLAEDFISSFGEGLEVTFAFPDGRVQTLEN